MSCSQILLIFILNIKVNGEQSWQQQLNANKQHQP